MNILGISYSIHETAACLLQEGKLQFACAEERLSGQKQDSRFPVRAIQAALDYGTLKPEQIDHVAIAWSKPGSRSQHDIRLMLTGRLPASRMRLERTFVKWLKDLRHRGGVVDYLRAFAPPRGEFHFINHHLAHALSAFCLSGFDDAAVLIVDGRGAREATTLWHAQTGRIRLLQKYDYPNSVGVFYAGITKMLGFVPLSDEWKVMGLAAYGKPGFDLSPLIQVQDESYAVSGRRFFGNTDFDHSGLEPVTGPQRNGEPLSEHHKELARSAQDCCEQTMLALLRHVTKLTGSRKLCLAGGVALNCKANGELIRSGMIDDIYVQPAAGDDGACIGAAYGVYQQLGEKIPSHVVGHTYLGTEHSNEAIESILKAYKIPYRRVENPAQAAAQLLSQNHLIGWFQGRMEFGPRALGNRSIISDPRDVQNRDRVNEAVKFRENWRPFAPSVIEERGHVYFQDFRPTPYMILSFWATDEAKARIPAVVHVDGSCRVQSVTHDSNPLYYDLIAEFEKLTGVPVVMNTSFNLKGDAIVESPRDAIQTFFTSGLDDLVIGPFLVSKSK
ncbi:MAG TPA: carbamoyltransferase C-terminal domain-containing protein [Planctomycetaceae bacterium]|jgi:carbamoyltransferase|nr:carbamoyltransferase C-terminal domain-containing protein [Planctomycetaceae bacterium]